MRSERRSKPSSSVPFPRDVSCRPRWLKPAICCALLLTAVTGCGPSPADRLIGRWQGSVRMNQAEVDRQRAAGDSPLKRNLQDFMLKGLEAMSVTLEFRADGQMAMGVAVGPLNKTRGGTWELVEHQADRLIINSVDDQGNQQTFAVKFEGPDSFVMEAVEGKPETQLAEVRFQRVTEPTDTRKPEP